MLRLLTDGMTNPGIRRRAAVSAAMDVPAEPRTNRMISPYLCLPLRTEAQALQDIRRARGTPGACDRFRAMAPGPAASAMAAEPLHCGLDRPAGRPAIRPADEWQRDPGRRQGRKG